MIKNTLSDRINFSRSHMQWGGASKGIFKLVSVLRLNLGNSKKAETTFGLGESVLAGNMYVSEGLLKQPPYLFQVAGSTEEQYIFRSILPNQKKSIIPSWFINKVGDTHQKNLFNDEFYTGYIYGFVDSALQGSSLELTSDLYADIMSELYVLIFECSKEEGINHSIKVVTDEYKEWILGCKEQLNLFFLI